MSSLTPRALRGTPAPGDRERWLQLVDGLDVDELTDTFISIVGTVPGYDPPPVPHSEIRRTGRLSFIALVNGLRDGGLSADIAVANDVGISRARAGVPITSLMTAIRADFTVLWEGLTRVARAEDAELIVRHTGIVLRTVDEYAGQTQQAYMGELQRMREQEASERRGLIATLFQGPSPSNEHLMMIATSLDLPLEAPLTVATAVNDDIAPLRVSVAELERAGAVVYTHHLGDTFVAFTRTIDLPGTRLSELLTALVTLRIGLTAAPKGLASVREASRIARELAHAFYPGETGAMTWARGWARLAANHLLAAGSPIMSDVHDALDTCGPAEQMRLEEAVRSYLRTGSVTDSAAELFCHRNTLTNRLRRFAELTGVDPTVPEQAARLVVGWA